MKNIYLIILCIPTGKNSETVPNKCHIEVCSSYLHSSRLKEENPAKRRNFDILYWCPFPEHDTNPTPESPTPPDWFHRHWSRDQLQLKGKNGEWLYRFFFKWWNVKYMNCQNKKNGVLYTVCAIPLRRRCDVFFIKDFLNVQFCWICPENVFFS